MSEVKMLRSAGDGAAAWVDGDESGSLPGWLECRVLGENEDGTFGWFDPDDPASRVAVLRASAHLTYETNRRNCGSLIADLFGRIRGALA